MTTLFGFSANKARIVVMIALLFSAFNYHLFAPVIDGFHEGEYLGSLWSLRSHMAGATAFPLLVHGPMDFIPAMAAAAIGDGGSVIVFTRLFNTLFAAAAWILFFDLILVCLKRTEGRLVYGGVALGLFVLMIAVTPSDVVQRQQAFLAIRDVFLVGMLWSFARGATTASPLPRAVFMVLAGAAAALSLYWAYDRAIASAAFLIGAGLALLVQKNWKDFAALVSGAVIALGVTPFALPVGSLAENLGNLLYWIRNSGEVWHMALTARVPAAPTALAMAVLLLLFGRVALDRFRASPRDALIPLIVGIGALQAFFLLKYVNLPRQPNNYYFVWPFLLLLCLAPVGVAWARSVEASIRTVLSGPSQVEVGRRVTITVLASVACLLVIASNNMLTAAMVNAKALLSPPSDQSLLPAAARDLETRLQAPEGCVLLWSNEGVFANALQRPVCTRYAYPVYASAAQEADLLAEITRAPPAVVVFDTPFWSGSIYGRSMRDRLPAVDAYLRANYEMIPHQGYVFGVPRTLSPATAGASR